MSTVLSGKTCLPVSDLLCAADTKILAREVALRYGGKPDGRGRVDSEHNLKRVRRKVKKLRKIRPRAQRQDCFAAQACHQSSR